MWRLTAVAAVFGAAALFSGPAAADETWTSDLVGQIVWQSDVSDTSIFTYEAGDATVKMYLEGLPGNVDNRRVMVGYWMTPVVGGPENGLCRAALTGVDGDSSYNWGRLEIRWSRRTFPTGFTARMTDCFGNQNPLTIRARPNVGG